MNAAPVCVGSGVGMASRNCICTTPRLPESNDARQARDGPGLPVVRFRLTALKMPVRDRTA
jgi:hypothetical protein